MKKIISKLPNKIENLKSIKEMQILNDKIKVNNSEINKTFIDFLKRKWEIFKVYDVNRNYLVNYKNVTHLINTLNSKNSLIFPAISLSHGLRIKKSNDIYIESIKFPNTASLSFPAEMIDDNNNIPIKAKINFSRGFQTFVTKKALDSKMDNDYLLKKATYETGTEFDLENKEINNRVWLAKQCQNLIDFYKNEYFIILLQDFKQNHFIKIESIHILENGDYTDNNIKNLIGNDNFDEFIKPIIDDYLKIHDFKNAESDLEILEALKECILEDGSKTVLDEGVFTIEKKLLKLQLNDIFNIDIYS